jgi:hypothetical protein
MLKKAEIITLCKHIALDYEDWEFVAGSFKYKKLKHTVLMVNPLWVFSSGSASCEPIVAIANKKIDKILSHIHRNPSWSHHMDIINIETGHPLTFRIYDIEKDDAENMIRAFFDDGLVMIEKTYDARTEEAILKSIPIATLNYAGLKTAVIQAYLGNPTYAQDFYHLVIDRELKHYKNAVRSLVEYFEIEP